MPKKKQISNLSELSIGSAYGPAAGIYYEICQSHYGASGTTYYPPRRFPVRDMRYPLQILAEEEAEKKTLQINNLSELKTPDERDIK